MSFNGITLICVDRRSARRVETIAELFTVLKRPKFRKYISPDSAIEYIEWYIGISETVTVTEQVIACRDPKDDKFLSLAVTGKADCLIAGDKDLLDMMNYEGIPIYRAADFIKLYCN